MLLTNQEIENEFKRVEDLFQSEVPESKTMPEAENGGYKAMLKAYMDIEATAFEVLYDEQLSEYQANPDEYHLEWDDSRVDWGETYQRLEALK